MTVDQMIEILRKGQAEGLGDNLVYLVRPADPRNMEPIESITFHPGDFEL
jgi:hypothetical protein